MGSILAALDVEAEPAVRQLDDAAAVAPSSWRDLVRWSADAGAEVGYGGDASVRMAGRLAVPLDLGDRLHARNARAQIDARLAALEAAAIRRDMAYGALDLVCRWGYLKALEPVLATLAAAPGDDLWSARLRGTRGELAALEAQVGVLAPATLDGVLTGEGFLCRLAVPAGAQAGTGGSVHPAIERVALEQASRAHQRAWLDDFGGPELAIDGSLEYRAERLDAGLRVGIRVPFGVPAGRGSATIEADDVAAALRINVNSDASPQRRGAQPENGVAVARERAALEYRQVAAWAAVDTLRLQEAGSWVALGGRATAACADLCLIALAAHLDAAERSAARGGSGPGDSAADGHASAPAARGATSEPEPPRTSRARVSPTRVIEAASLAHERFRAELALWEALAIDPWRVAAHVARPAVAAAPPVGETRTVDPGR